jgi:hypothetical protein
MQHDLYNGPFDTPGPILPFTTGSLPSISGGFPAVSTVKSPTAPTSTSYPYVWEMRTYVPFAHDLYNNVVWYLGAGIGNPAESGYGLRNTNAGTLLVFMDDPSVGGYNHEFLREFDLAGNLVHETNWGILNKTINIQRAALGQTAANITWFSHEAYRLPNGYTAVLMTDERVANQGQGNVDVLGDIVVVLDNNWQPVWTWDAFDYLPITRMALMNDTCAGGPGCPPLTLKMPNGQPYTRANDWTHMNSITLDPSDGNLVVSIRHQAWVLKLAYANGGNAHVIWTLGNGGSFSLPSGTPSTAWFSYQHDAEFWSNGQLTLFDNGNLRVSQFGGNSRGQAWTVNTQTMVATPVVNIDLGVYSQAVGYASVLSNGNYEFEAGFLNGGTETQNFEYTPSGSLVFSDKVQAFSYRGIRIPDFYTQR